MSTYNPNTKNVFSGPNSLINYFNPDLNPPLPLVELPKELNPFYDDGVRVFAKMLTMLPAGNVKSLPAISLLEKGNVISLHSTREARSSQTTHTIVESSSGSTVTSLSMIARQHNIPNIRAWMSNKVSPTKSCLMRFLGLELALFGGPSQSPPSDPMGGIAKAANQGKEQGCFNPNQYENPANPAAHERWTGRQLLHQMPDINVFAGGMGTGGTITGTAKKLKQVRGGDGVHVVGVCVARGDKVPGPRPRELLEPVDFGWKGVVDDVQDVASKESYTLSMQLCRYGIVCGPSSGFALQGLFQVLETRKKAGTLSQLRQEQDGEPVKAVFLCCDLPYQYVDEYFTKCDSKLFKPIVNEHLFDVDQYKYSTSWILDIPSTLTMLVYPRFNLSSNTANQVLPELGQLDSDSDSSPSTPTTPSSPGLLRPAILDLRSRTSYSSSHLAHSRNIPLSSLNPDDPSPYQDSVLLATQFTELNKRFIQLLPTPATPHIRGDIPVAELNRMQLGEMIECLKRSQREVLVVDYTGETAKLAVSVLRQAGVKAFSTQGGFEAMVKAGFEMVKA